MSPESIVAGFWRKAAIGLRKRVPILWDQGAHDGGGAIAQYDFQSVGVSHEMSLAAVAQGKRGMISENGMDLVSVSISPHTMGSEAETGMTLFPCSMFRVRC